MDQSLVTLANIDKRNDPIGFDAGELLKRGWIMDES
jgi:hypothetical protein